MPQPTITITPDPPVAGQALTVSYSGQKPTTLDIDFDPAGTPATVSIDASGNGTVIVPAGTSSLVISDWARGGADEVARVCEPKP